MNDDFQKGVYIVPKYIIKLLICIEFFTYQNFAPYLCFLFLLYVKYVKMYSFNLSALFALNIGSSLASNRTYIILGGLFGCSAYLISAVIKDISYLILSHGVIFGKKFIHRQIFRDKSIQVTKLLLEIKKKYYSDIICEIGNDQKKLYKLTNSLMGKQNVPIFP